MDRDLHTHARNYDWMRRDIGNFVFKHCEDDVYKIEVLARLKTVHRLWLHVAQRWFDEFNCGHQKPSIDFIDGLSHLKHAGILLWALNSTKPFVVKKVNPEICVAVDDATDILVTFTNEYVSFYYVYMLFFNTQNRRVDLNLTIPHMKMSHSYLKSICKYLHLESPSAYSLYMIFKSFDLYMIK